MTDKGSPEAALAAHMPVLSNEVNALAELALQARGYDNCKFDGHVNADPLTTIWKFPVGIDNDHVNVFVRDAARPKPDVTIVAAYCIGPVFGVNQLFRLEQIRLENHAVRSSRSRYRPYVVPDKYSVNDFVMKHDKKQVDRPAWDTFVLRRDEKKAKRGEDAEYLAMIKNAQPLVFDRLRFERFHDVLEIAIQQAKSQRAPVATKE